MEADHVRRVKGSRLVEEYAKHLRKVGEIDQPAWVAYVKTSHAKQLEPRDDDWFYMRCGMKNTRFPIFLTFEIASVARKLYLNPNHGLTWLAKKYSARKNRGAQPEHVFRGSRSVIRACLKRLEGAGLVKCNKRRGRTLTEKGRKELNEVAQTIDSKQ